MARDRVTGEDCFLARAHVKSVKDLERLIDQVIPYAITNTSIIQSSTVETCSSPQMKRDGAWAPSPPVVLFSQSNELDHASCKLTALGPRASA